MLIATSVALAVTLLLFVVVGLRARSSDTNLDDYLTARNSQSSWTLGLSFLASGLGAWILFAPPELGALVGPWAVVGYALGAALPFWVLAACASRIRARLPGGRSIGEFAQLRFGIGMRRWVSLLSVLYMLCFLTAELTAIGAITALLSDVPPAWVIVAVAGTTLAYTALGGLRASLQTDRWQALLLVALLLLIGGWLLVAAPANAFDQPLPAIPVSAALSVALTLVIAVTAANLFHQGYWQRLWAARDNASLVRASWIGGLGTVAAIALLGGLGMLAVMSGVALGTPPMPFFALLEQAPPWLLIAVLVLAVALVASSIDTLQSGVVSLLVNEVPGFSVRMARWATVLLMIPVVLVSLQGYSVLRLFLIADLLCATAVVPVLMGLWSRTGPRAAIAGCLAGLVGAVVPGWWATGSLWAGVVAASFPNSIPTLGPFLGALIASTVVCYGLSLLRPQGTLPCSTTS